METDLLMLLKSSSCKLDRNFYFLLKANAKDTQGIFQKGVLVESTDIKIYFIIGMLVDSGFHVTRWRDSKIFAWMRDVAN